MIFPSEHVKYRTDYNNKQQINNPPNVISFMSTITSTSGRLHSEFVLLLFLQAHRETDGKIQENPPNNTATAH